MSLPGRLRRAPISASALAPVVGKITDVGRDGEGRHPQTFAYADDGNRPEDRATVKNALFVNLTRAPRSRRLEPSDATRSRRSPLRCSAGRAGAGPNAATERAAQWERERSGWGLLVEFSSTRTGTGASPRASSGGSRRSQMACCPRRAGRRLERSEEPERRGRAGVYPGAPREGGRKQAPRVPCSVPAKDSDGDGSEDMLLNVVVGVKGTLRGDPGEEHATASPNDEPEFFNWSLRRRRHRRPG